MTTVHPKFQRVLVAIDDSPCSLKAIEYAKEVTKLLKTSIALVTVVPPTTPASYGADPLLGQQPIIVPEVTEIQEKSAQEFLERISREFEEANEVFVFNKVGSVKQEILSVAQEWAADLIIIGSNGRTGFDHFISGSVSEGVIRKSLCPVMVIPGKAE
ncbi:universal stress protein [Sphingobacterium spiritivorum]|uniref:universal stress protein n=1 Tax=Sphingobacterium spiritivorum TaxID=258 RepID=UPI003DA4C338